MPFTNVDFSSSGQTIRVEHEEDATDDEIRQLAKEKLEQGGSLLRTGVGIGADIAVAEGGKVGAAALGGILGAPLGVPGMVVGGAIGYTIGALSAGSAGSYIRQKIMRPGQDISEGEMVADVMINFLPAIGKVGKGAGLLKRSAQQVAMGGGISAGAVTVESLVEEGNLPTLEALAKAGATGGVMSLGLHMASDAFTPAYQKYAGRKPDVILEGLRKGDPDAQELANGVMRAAHDDASTRYKTWKKQFISFRQKWDDDLIRLRQMQDQSGRIHTGRGDLITDPDVKIRTETGDIIKEGTDAHMNYRLSRGIIRNKMSALSDDLTLYSDNLKKTAQQAGVDPAALQMEIDQYLQARYARVFNNGKDPISGEIRGDGAAGKSVFGTEMTNANAERIVKQFENDYLKTTGRRAGGPILTAQIETMDKIVGDLRRTLYDSGMITFEKYLEFESNNLYVPLNRVPEEGFTEGNVIERLFGGGGDVRTPSVLRRATGDPDKSAVITDNIVKNTIEVIRIAENNKSNLSFKRLLEDPRNKKYAGQVVKIQKDPKIKPLGKDDPVLTVYDPENPYTYKNRKGEAVTSIRYKMNFADGIEPEIALSIRGVNKAELGKYLKANYAINKVLGGVYTGLSPLSFTPANFVRDRAVSAMNTYKNLDAGAFRGILNPREALSEMNAIKRALFKGPDGKPRKGKNARQIAIDKQYKSFLDDGGSTGGVVTDLFTEIDKDMGAFSFKSNLSIKAKARAFLNFIKKANQIVEDSTRFSVYRQHIKAGISSKEAAFAARNASFDPLQRGTSGDVLKATYLFSNPTIQSTKNFWRSMKDPKLWKPVMAFTFGTAAMLEIYNRLMDPDWRDKVKGGPDKSSWRLNKNLIVVSPFSNEDGSLSYAQVPLAYEVAPVWTALNGMAQLVTGAPDNMDNIIKETTSSIIDGYNPTGGSLVPTVPLRILELTMLNKDGLGREIVPQRLLDENMAAYGKVHPWTAQTVGGEIAIELSKEIENLGAQVSPEKLKHLFQISFGGAGQDMLRVFDLTSKLFNGEEIKTRDVPLFRRFFGSTYADSFEQRTGMEVDLKLFDYEQNTLNSQNYQDSFAVMQRLKEIDDPLEKELSLQAELATANKSVQRRVKKMIKEDKMGITRTDRQIRELGVENGLRSEFYQQQIDDMPPEAVGLFLAEQKRKNILTDRVEKQLRISNALKTISYE